MWFHCTVTAGSGKYRLGDSKLVRRVLRGFNPEKGKSWHGFGLIAHQAGIYLILPHGKLGARMLWLDLPQPHNLLARCDSGRLIPVAELSSFQSNMPVPIPDTSIHISEPGFYILDPVPARICDAIPLSATQVAALLEPPAQLDMRQLNRTMDQLKQAIPIPAGTYWTDGDTEFLQFQVADTPAQLAYLSPYRPRVELTRSDWESLQSCMPNTMNKHDLPDLVELSAAEYDRLRRAWIIDDQIDPVVAGTGARWKPILDRALAGYNLLLSSPSTYWIDRLKERLQVSSVYLMLHEIRWHLMNRYTFSFVVGAADVSYRGRRYIAVPVKVSLESVYGIVTSIVDGIQQ